MRSCIELCVQHGIGLSGEVEEIMISAGRNFDLKMEVGEFEKLKQEKRAMATLITDNVANMPKKKTWRERFLDWAGR